MATTATPLGRRRAGEQRVVGVVFEEVKRTYQGQDYRCKLYLDRAAFKKGKGQNYGAARGEFSYPITVKENTKRLMEGL